MDDTMSCCGVVCSSCRDYLTECPGCAAIEGKVFWTQYTGEPVCDIYDCCIRQRGLSHCGQCAGLPCERYGRDDPTKTPEENAQDHRVQLTNLRRRREGIELLLTDGAHPDFVSLCGALDVFLCGIVGEEVYRIIHQPHNAADGLHTALIAYRDGVPAGCCGIRRAGPTTAEIKRVYVRPEDRGQGIGERLMSRLEEEALRQGNTRLVLETGEALREAVRLYHRLGYREIPRYGSYVERDDSICMEKTLGVRKREDAGRSAKHIEVSAAIFVNEQDEVLICRRGAGGSCAFLWEFPGGKREPGESFEQCLVRECREELAVGIEVGPLFEQTDYDYPDLSVSLYFFQARILSGEPRMDVHSAMRWAARGALDQYEFCPADRDVVRKLTQQKEPAV